MIGHQKQQTFFERVLEQENHNHAYILVGPRHVGKTTLACFVASKILKVEQHRLAQHPDFLMVQRLHDEKTDRMRRDLSVSDIRDAVHFASQSPLYDKGYKIIIIEEAERLNTEASNALLKMLEEPPLRTIFFLLYNNEATLLPTIRSRAHIIPCPPVNTTELLAGLKEFGFSAKEKSEESFVTLVTEAQGLPGLAFTWLQNPEDYETFLSAKKEFLGLWGLSFADKLAHVEHWFEDAKETSLGPDFLIDRLVFWQGILRSMLWNQLSNTQSCPPRIWLMVQEKIIEALFDLRRNVHPRLVIESVLLTLP